MTKAVPLRELEKTAAKIAELIAGRNELIKAAARAGFSSTEVANVTGLTRQRVWQIINDK